MTALIHLAWCLFAALFFLALPGLVAVRLAFGQVGESRPLLRWMLAIAWGTGVVPSLSFFIHLATGVEIGGLTLLCAALAHFLPAIWVTLARRRRGQDAGLAWWLEGLEFRSVAPWLLGSLSVGLLYFLRYSDLALAPENSCIFSAALSAMGEKDAGVNLLFENVEDARLGNTGVISGYLALFDAVGYRALHGTCGLLLALSGCVLGNSLGRS
ncbi:MAG: hypothetical protein VX498_13085, partial [Myxococcota bacterium]|nr:hypothetical protein [Myxococcota bacterium]